MVWIKDAKIVVWKDGTWEYVQNGVTFEYENDPDWLCTIPLQNVIPKEVEAIENEHQRGYGETTNYACHED